MSRAVTISISGGTRLPSVTTLLPVSTVYSVTRQETEVTTLQPVSLPGQEPSLGQQPVSAPSVVSPGQQIVKGLYS